MSATDGLDDEWLADTRTSYDEVAPSYVDMTSGWLDDDVHDRVLLGLFAELVLARGGGPVVDVGCGPGHVTAHLSGLGLDASGVDLSPGMVGRARQDHPDLRFEVGSMTDLNLPGSSAAGLLAWYSLIHVPDEAVPGVLAHFARVLRPGGVLLLGVHVGDETRLKTQGYGGHPMRVHVHLRPLERLSACVVGAGFVVDQLVLRDPHAEVPQGRLLAHRP